MTNDKALALTKAWCVEAHEQLGNHLKVSSNGDFSGVFGAAEITYVAQAKKLYVDGLVNYDASELIEYPELFDDFERAENREAYTLGEGRFHILNTPGREHPQLTLRKEFSDGSVTVNQFVKEIDWLMQWSTYWRLQRSYDVNTKSEEELVREGAKLDAWARKNRPRPW